MPKDYERTRDFLPYEDSEIAKLPWWKRWIRRFERVFVLNR